MHGYIYFIQEPTKGNVKIGFSVDPMKRLKSLQTASPSPLLILAACPGTMADEKALHRRFSEDHVSGEWFHPSPSLTSVINRVDHLMNVFKSWEDLVPINTKSPKRHDSPSRKALGDNLDLLQDLFNLQKVDEIDADGIVLRLANNTRGIDPAGDIMAYGIEAATIQGIATSNYIIGCCTRGLEQGNVRV